MDGQKNNLPDSRFDLTFGRNKWGRLVPVSEVSRGLACECTCPHCGCELEARKGLKRQHHFAHHNPNHKGGTTISRKECYDNTLHLLAIQIIVDEKCAMLPKYDTLAAKKIHFTKVSKEFCIPQTNIRPDIIGTTDDGKKYLIEIRVTHAVPKEKRQKIQALGFNALEIDIRNQKMDDNELKSFLLDSSEERYWLNYPDGDKLLEEERKRAEEEKRKEREEERKEREEERKEREEERKRAEEEQRIEERNNIKKAYEENISRERQRIQREEEKRKKGEDDSILWEEESFCLSPKENISIDSYYTIITKHMNKTFYKDRTKETLIVNWQRNINMFSVVHVDAKSMRYYFTIVYWNGTNFVHKTSKAYPNDYHAAIAGNHRIGIQ